MWDYFSRTQGTPQVTLGKMKGSFDNLRARLLLYNVLQPYTMKTTSSLILQGVPNTIGPLPAFLLQNVQTPVFFIITKWSIKCEAGLHNTHVSEVYKVCFELWNRDPNGARLLRRQKSHISRVAEYQGCSVLNLHDNKNAPDMIFRKPSPGRVKMQRNVSKQRSTLQNTLCSGVPKRMGHNREHSIFIQMAIGFYT